MATPDRTAASTFDRVANDLAHQAFPDLAEALRTRTDLILKHWRNLGLKAMPHLNALTLEEFENHISNVLSAAANALKSARPEQLRDVLETGLLHGVSRFVQQHSLLDLFEEVRILRGVVILEVANQLERVLTIPEAATFHAIFDIIIQQGVMAMVEKQNGELQQSQSTMRGLNEELVVGMVRQNELLEQTHKAEAALADELRRKDEFLAMLSHELRNPLAPISSAVHLLRSQELPGRENRVRKAAREVIERQVAKLTKLVSDLLEVSRFVSGRIRLDRQTVDLNQVIQYAVETATPLFEQRKHALSLKLGDDSLWVIGDVTRLEEVLANLLNNAAKYTPDGGHVEVSCEQPTGTTYVEVRVRDNGVGIEEELLRGGRIFELFTQADRSLARSGGGLGIGLSLAHRLLGLHGGSIEARSPPEGVEKGSEFIVRLPLVPPPLPRAGDVPEVPLGKPEGRRILVVDDNIDQVMMLSALLRYEGYSVETANSGTDGLKVAQQWRPDVILLDIGLPDLNGYEVARRLRAEPTLGSAGMAMRLIAMTGYGRDSDLVLAREAGFDNHLTKPVEFKDLEKELAAPAPSITEPGLNLNQARPKAWHPPQGREDDSATT